MAGFPWRRAGGGRAYYAHKNKSLGGLFVSLAFVAASACAATQTTAAGPLAARADAIAEAAMEKGPYPGMAISISKNGETIYAKGHGLANIEYETPIVADTVFPIGSITKSFTALAIAQLAAAGELSLDDSVTKYVDGLPEDKEKIKIRHLLNHTSGLFNYTNDQNIQDNPGCRHTHQEMLAYFKDKPLAFEPGAQFSYTNSGTYLLGMAVETVSGQTYGEYLSEHVFQPFGMEDTSYPDFSKIIKGRAHGYYPGEEGFKNAEQYSPTIPFSAGALLSTTADLETYAEAVHQSDLVSDDVRSILYAHATLEDGSSLQYALGSLIIRDVGGRKKISHSGDIFGFSSHLAHYPEENVTISVLTNNQRGMVHPSSIEHKLARAVFDEPDPAIKNLPLEPGQVEALVGDYSTYPMIFGAPVIGIVQKEGRLALAFGGVAAADQAIPLLYQGDDKFVFAIDEEVKISFTTGDDGAASFELEIYDGMLTAHKSKS